MSKNKTQFSFSSQDSVFFFLFQFPRVYIIQVTRGEEKRNKKKTEKQPTLLLFLKKILKLDVTMDQMKNLKHLENGSAYFAFWSSC